MKVREVVLFDGEHGMAPETSIWAEAFTKLSQTAGTLGSPLDIDFIPIGITTKFRSRRAYAPFME